MTSREARAQGFTQEIEADSDAMTLALLVRPGTDYDDRFTAWDPETEGLIRVNGWLFTVEEA